jgi:hypothetical protein
MKKDTPRKIAKSLGLKRYQEVPCTKGHSGIRFVTSMDCVECRAFLKAMASRRKRAERGPVKQGRPKKYPELIGPPKPFKKHPPKPITSFDFWVRRNRVQRTERTKLSVEYYQTLYVTHCPLLGIELTYENCGQKAAPPNYATLDRIDATKGYEEGNVQILSFRANTIKGDATLEELKTIVRNWEKP